MSQNKLRNEIKLPITVLIFKSATLCPHRPTQPSHPSVYRSNE